MILRQWALLPQPLDTDDPDVLAFSVAMVMAATNDPHPPSFTRRGAERQSRFYTHTLGLPMRFDIVDRRA